MTAMTMQAPASRSPEVLAEWLTLTLDHVGRGMLLVTDGARVLHANRLARLTLDDDFPLQMDAGRLCARRPSDAAQLDAAVQGAVQRGLRRMLVLADGTLPVAVLPLQGDGAAAALISLPREARSRDLSLQSFARQHGLSDAETGVLECLAAGDTPQEIARRKGVRLSTVRTQIGQLRSKTGTGSIRQLLDRVACLPPMMAALQ